jgi:hypothetical protein
MQPNNEKAVSNRVLLSDGSQKTLKSFWKDKPVILVFLRHFG